MCWNHEHQTAFQTLKDSLCENTLNNFFIKGRPTNLGSKFIHEKKILAFLTFNDTSLNYDDVVNISKMFVAS